ncbi:leucine-rich repeat-containing protein 56 [Lampris incognitus]|uniref:leucine-rich repeat-containing protein 56 n=1 Tax=Lampris incognitus TaxID=2546036 RepID=UPI0024B49BBB|nr:leucine-rich repeat-containing protein 56 [Lampris incognitus]
MVEAAVEIKRPADLYKMGCQLGAMRLIRDGRSLNSLKSLFAAKDLSQMTSLEICVDTRENTMGNIGANLPKLVQLKMNNSMILSVRDLGTSLSHLQVLWMSGCCLQDLDGIPSFSSLKELYVAYNSVSDLSQVSMLENLQLLDLEGNNVDDLVQVQYLGLCAQLHTLTMEGNPVCVRPHPTATQMEEYNYRVAVRELIPHLRYLDDVKVEEEGHCSSSIMGEDWSELQDLIRDRNFTKAAAEDETACACNRLGSPTNPSFSPSYVQPFSSVGSRPLTASRLMSVIGHRALLSSESRPCSAKSDQDDASVLTHGAGKTLFYGNPVQALRVRREKLRTAPTASLSTTRDLPIFIPEHTYDNEEPDVGERGDVFAQLRAWSKQHAKRLQLIEKETSPEILTIEHSDDEEESEDEGEGLGVTKSVGSDEEYDREVGEGKRGEGADAISPDSSFQSLSPDLSYGEAFSPDVTRLSLSPDTTLSPSPPLSDTTARGNWKPSGIHKRRLRLNPASGTALSLTSSAVQLPEAERRVSNRVQEVVKPKVPQWPLTTHIPHRPTSSPFDGRLRDQCAGTALRSVQLVNQHETLRPLERPAILRPLTARAALQKHRQQNALEPSRGRSHLD